MRSLLLAILRVAVGVGLVVYLVESRAIDPHALTKLATAWPVSIAAIAIFLLDFALMAWRLCILLRPQGMRLPFGASLQLTLLSSFFAVFLPGRAGGDLARFFYASKDHSRRAEIITVLLFDRALGLFSLLMLPLLFSPLFPRIIQESVVRILLITSAALATGMATGFLFCAFMPPEMFGFARPNGLAARFLSAVRGYRRKPGALAAALCIAFADNLMVIAVTALAVRVVEPASLTMRLCLVVPMGEIVNSLPITPGGLGVGETAFDALFRVVGLRGGAEALICWRIWNILASIPGLPLYLRGFRGRVEADMRPENAAGSPRMSDA